MRPKTLILAAASILALAACGQAETPTPAQPAAETTAAPMTAGQRLQARRAAAAQQQIEAQMQAQMTPAQAPSTSKPQQ